MNPVIKWVVGLGLLFTLWYYLKHPLTTTATIRGISYHVDLAVTPQEKEVGLGGREKLSEKTGMLFPYDHTEKFSFWMKGMKFPIDIIWIRDATIVDITHSAPVSNSPQLPVYSPKEEVNKVLEIPAGDAKKHGFEIGDTVVVDN